MSTLSEGERVRLALRSEQELALTDSCFDGLRIAMVNRLIGSDFDEGAVREHLYHALRALEDVQAALKTNVRKGNDAKAYEEAARQMAQGAKA